MTVLVMYNLPSNQPLFSIYFCLVLLVCFVIRDTYFHQTVPLRQLIIFLLFVVVVVAVVVLFTIVLRRKNVKNKK